VRRKIKQNFNKHLSAAGHKPAAAALPFGATRAGAGWAWGGGSADGVATHRGSDQRRGIGP